VTTVVLALLFSGALIGVLGEASHQASSTDSLPAGYQSTTVAALEDQLPESKGSVAVVLFTAGSGDLTATERQTLETGFGRLAGEGGPPAGLQWSQDGTAGIGIVPVDATGATQVADAVKKLRSQADELAP
jgi:RND superfamily putative drug exporter